MKRYLLIPAIVTLLTLPVFGTAKADVDKIISTNAQSLDNNKHSKTKLTAEKNKKSETNHKSIVKKSAQDKNGDKHSSKHKANINKKDRENPTESDETENENLKDIGDTESSNIQQNLKISENEVNRLNREMMLDGAQGGIQNNQLRGVG